MKKQLTTLVLITTLFTTSFSAAVANEGGKIELKSEQEVVNTLNKKGKKIVRNNSEDLNIYLAVMELYHNDPASFYNLDETTKERFFAATENLTRSLSTSGKKDLRRLGDQLAFNEAVSNYIWSIKKAGHIILPVVEVAQQTSL